MRILMATILDTKRDINGVTVSSGELTRSLKNRSNVVGLVTPFTIEKNSTLLKFLKLNGLFYRVSRSSFITLNALLLKMLIIYIQIKRLKHNYEYFHSHDVFSAFACLKATGSKKVNLLSTHFHDKPSDEFVAAGFISKNSITYWLINYITIKTLKHNNLSLIPVSNYNHRFVNTQWNLKGDCQTETIYSGISKKNNKTISRNNFEYLINVGSINNRKNQIKLIEILAELHELGSKISLILVGLESKEEKEKIQRMIDELELNSKIIFMGKQSIEKTRKLIANAKLYIHSAKQESFGLTLIESMAQQIPVLACEYEAVHEILDEDAIIQSDWNPSKAAKHIYNFLINNTKRNQLQKKQYKHFLNNFTSDIMVKKYITLLKNSWRFA